MAVEVEKLIVSLEARVDGYNRQLAQAQAQTNKHLAAIESRFAQTTAKVRDGAGSMGAALGAIGTYIGGRAVAEYANAWTRVTRSIDAGEQVFGLALKTGQELNDLANDSRIDVEAYAKTYIRTAAAIRDYGYDSETAAKVTSTLAKALKLGSASASEQASTILQFSQALQKGKLDGDEFRTVMENAGIVQELLAKRLGVTKGKIVEMAAAGQLQIPHLVGALADGGAQIERIFKEMPATIDEAFSVLRNNTIRFIGELDQANGASQAIADGIVRISHNLDAIAVAAGALLGSATLRMVSFAAATASATNPLTLVAAAVGALATAYVVYGDKVDVVNGNTISLRDSLIALAEVAGEDVKTAVGEAGAAMQRLGDRVSGVDPKLEQSKSSWREWADTVSSAMYKIFKLAVPFDEQIGEFFSSQTERVMKRARMNSLASAFAEIQQYGKGIDPPPHEKKDPGTYGADKKSQFEREIDQIKKRTAALQSELQVISATEFAQERSKAAAELRFALGQTAAKEGRKVTAEETAAIDKLSDAYGKAAVEVAFLKKLQSTREESDDLENEIALVGKYGYELERARKEQELLTAARRAGVDLTPEMQEQIEAEAEQRARLKQHLETINQIRETSRDALKGFITDMRDGTSAAEALGNALNRISDRLIDMGVNGLVEAALGPLFGGGSGAASSSGLGKLFGFAGGGMVRGPGTGTSDSVPARLSNGEFVVNADATRQFQPLLEAINAGKVSSFAAGGAVNVPKVAIPTAVPARAGGPPTVNVNAVFNVANGTADGVEKLKSELVPTIKQLARNEIVQAFDRSSRFSRSGM